MKKDALDDDGGKRFSQIDSSSSSACCVCLGVWQEPFTRHVAEAIQREAEPYGQNAFSLRVSPPMLSLPGDILYRYRLLASTCESPDSLTAFASALKRHARRVVESACSGESKDEYSSYPRHVHEEEQGYLAAHIIATPAAEVLRPTSLLSHTGSKSNKRRNRKRKLDLDSQGGDPRENLEIRIARKEGIAQVVSITQALSLLSDESHDTVLPTPPDEAMMTQKLPKSALDLRAAVWRRPFFLRSTYTKTRRDVSQTPFFVTDDGERRKLGVTSVEEQILLAITKFCCGISDRNNNPQTNQIRFGMAKFHAAGREDMDVKMLLPTSTIANVTGRPFVCEITDAYRMPSLDDLAGIVQEINKTKELDKSSTKLLDPRSHGRNPMGVGISTDLSFVPSKSFSNLQSETENKVKYYGCLCWSKEPLTSHDHLKQSLPTERFPLEIQQRTPLRVLHRRSNMIRTRHILRCTTEWINDPHYFRLHLGAEAGSYIKEFVHGDLGRTRPSIATLLGCKVDILELDCEGIEISDVK